MAYGPGALPLSAVVSWSRPSSPAVMLRENLTPVVIADASVAGGDLGRAADAVRAAVARVPRPEGYRVEVGGQVESARETRRQLAAVFGAGLVLVLAILLVQLRTLRLALVVLIGAPVALVGALVTLWVTGIPLDASSLMGCVLLAGLVVKNGILLLEHAQGELDAGTPLAAALADAGERRLRPILMTTIATIAGLAPLALGIGAGSEIQRPLAVATIGGLVVSTLVTLFGVPSLAALLHRRRRRGPPAAAPELLP
jgi:multidrug efflux pump subunit AcrB